MLPSLRRWFSFEYQQSQRDRFRQCFKPRLERLEDRLAPTVTVYAPVVNPPIGPMAVEGALTSFNLGSFSDPTTNATSWTVDVDWKDNTAHTSFTITAQGALDPKPHTYYEEGSYLAAVTITNNLNTFGSATFLVTVSDPAVVGTPLQISTVAGAPYVGAVGTFTDPGGTEPNGFDPSGTIYDHYQVTSIDWGDGPPLDTSTGTLSYSGSPGSTTAAFTISGNHTYAAAGPYTITCTIDHEGVSTTFTSTANSVSYADATNNLLVQVGKAPIIGQASIATGGTGFANSGNQTALLNTLSDALSDFNSTPLTQADINAGVKKLNHFISQVMNLENAGLIDSGDAALWIAEAQEIITAT
ncbi:MAG TPA: hypothetical protein VKU02_11680 [Gemmataceae bacterium]|nr:hypothetical protein [Gemmataceae bacterium]